MSWLIEAAGSWLGRNIAASETRELDRIEQEQIQILGQETRDDCITLLERCGERLRVGR